MKKCSKCKIKKEFDQYHKKGNGYRSRCKICRKDENEEARVRMNIHRGKNRKEICERERKRNQRPEVKTKRNKKARELRKRDPQHRIRHNLRCRLNKALKGINKVETTLELLGCNSEFFKEYLENNFLDGMTWENYGEWHIDHMKPCAAFDLTNEDDQRKCFHYTNLQPLWALDNIIKGANFTP